MKHIKNLFIFRIVAPIFTAIGVIILYCKDMGTVEYVLAIASILVTIILGIVTYHQANIQLKLDSTDKTPFFKVMLKSFEQSKEPELEGYDVSCKHELHILNAKYVEVFPLVYSSHSIKFLDGLSDNISRAIRYIDSTPNEILQAKANIENASMTIKHETDIIKNNANNLQQTSRNIKLATINLKCCTTASISVIDVKYRLNGETEFHPLNNFRANYEIEYNKGSWEQVILDDLKEYEKEYLSNKFYGIQNDDIVSFEIPLLKKQTIKQKVRIGKERMKMTVFLPRLC